MGGKRIRRTRWRVLDIADDVSDSEESTHAAPGAGIRFVKSGGPHQHQRAFSSQSTPSRRRHHDAVFVGGAKSTRSSSSASGEHKITFNEEEYTKITTPRQDVLFKKGYLNKPRTYQTQTSTGTSTTSTGNSTGNGTPDHQSTDLEYESQFMFPNGFVDQNGIYYVNSYEPYPFMIYNPSTYYPEYTNDRKRYSTGSLTESTSPNNEEVTSQDLSQSGGEASVSEYNPYPPFYNMVYPGYYVNGVCTPNDLGTEQATDPAKRLKKRRRRKTSKSQDETSEYTDDSEEEDEDTAKSRPLSSLSTASCSRTEENREGTSSLYPQPEIIDVAKTTETPSEKLEEAPQAKEETMPESPKEPQKYDLKPDAEEFVPRSLRHQELPPIPIKIIPPNFVPIPLVPVTDFSNHPPFIPPGIPVNFFPHEPKMVPNIVSFIPPPVAGQCRTTPEENSTETVAQVHCSEPTTANQKDDVQTITSRATIDMASVVSKLEEAKKEQDQRSEESNSASKTNSANPRLTHPKFKNGFRRNNQQNRARSSPIVSGDQTPTVRSVSRPNATQTTSTPQEPGSQRVYSDDARSLRNSPEKFRKPFNQNGYSSPRHNAKMYTNNYQNKYTHKNYSDILKNPESPHKYARKQAVAAPQKTEKPENEVRATTPLMSKPNQWISVSNRKKRKNKGAEETKESFEADETLVVEEELFESYDVNLLEDVVPSGKESVTKIDDQPKDTTVEEVLTHIISSNSVAACDGLTFPIPEVSEIEKDLIKNEENAKMPSDAKEDNGTTLEKPAEEFKAKQKKKTKKPVTKRIIITDIDLSKSQEKEEEKVEIKEEKPAAPIVEIEPFQEEVVKPQPEEEPAKKSSKKKKKKPAAKASQLTSSLSSSSATLSAASEDTYDFLIDNSILTKEDTTNDEISQQLDKIIQRGMYSSLEDKIKSMNIVEHDDDFFRSVINEIAAKEDKTCQQTKVLDLGKVFQKPPPLKPVSVEETPKIQLDANDISLPDLDATTATSQGPGFFLDENPEDNQDDYATTKTTNNNNDDVKLYPITQAVKEWMTKTRETTPEVEILKSPKTILKEQETLIKTTTNLSTEENDDDEEEEIVLYNSNREQSVDLLECWEDEFPKGATNNLCSTTTSSGCAKCNKDSVSTGDEVLEVYESKYGKNEDYLNLQKEIADQKLPKHSGLPHRAVCCTLQ